MFKWSLKVLRVLILAAGTVVYLLRRLAKKIEDEMTDEQGV